MTNKTLQPQHWTERSRQIIFLLVYVAIVESTFPTPFIQSQFGKLIYFLILFYILKGVWRLKQERSPRFHAQTQRWYEKWQTRRYSVTDYTRYRIQRIARFFFLLYAMGWLVDGATDKCTGALSCGVALPSLLIDNWQALIFFMMQLMLGMGSLFLMMWALARMDLHRTILPDSIETRFTDIYGQDAPLARLQEMQGILDYPDTIEALGGYMPGGVLLMGPPGTGKTLMAEAFAGETGRPFVSVGPESFTNMFMGVPILKVKMLFRHLRKLAVKHGGVVCFFDEIDALGSRGTGMIDQFLARIFQRTNEDNIIMGNMGAGSGALQMLLTEMSGIAKPKGLFNKVRVMLGFKPVPPPRYRILWIGATNMSEALDPALLRPGRFDRKIQVGFPDIPGRRETFQGYLDKVQYELTDEQIDTVARENPHATGASIKDAVNEALLSAVRDDREIITWDDLRDAIMWKMLGEDEGRMDMEQDRWRVALHEAAHAVASVHFRPEAPIQFASVIKRSTGSAGAVRAVDLEDRFTLQSRLIADIKCALASVWAEKFFFEDNLSAGPRNDLEKATNIASNMFARLGMGSTVMVWDIDEIPESLQAEIRDFLHEMYEELHEFMYSRKDQVELVAQLLDKHGTIDGDEIVELVTRMEE